MIKIGCPSFGTDSGRSGIGSYFIELLKRFDQAGPEYVFELIGPQKDADIYLKDTKNIQFFQIEGADSSPIQNFFWNQRELPGICKDRGYDLLFLPAANRRLTSKAPCPTVGTVHDLASLHLKGKYDFAHMVFNRQMLPRLIKKLDSIITVSEFSRQDIIRFAHVPGDRVTVIHLAADTERFNTGKVAGAAEIIGKKYGFKKPYLLYISRLEHPGKNHVNLIKAFDLFKKEQGTDHMLVLPGPDKERAEEIHAVAEASPYKKDIVFPGFIDTEEVADFYREADLFVLPSRFEGFGLPLLEAMSCGTPVISSHSASLPEVGGPHTPLFDPNDISGMKNAIIQVLSSKASREDLAQKGVDWASNFSWDITVEKTLDIFRKTVGEKR